MAFFSGVQQFKDKTAVLPEITPALCGPKTPGELTRRSTTYGQQKGTKTRRQKHMVLNVSQFATKTDHRPPKLQAVPATAIRSK